MTATRIAKWTGAIVGSAAVVGLIFTVDNHYEKAEVAKRERGAISAAAGDAHNEILEVTGKKAAVQALSYEEQNVETRLDVLDVKIRMVTKPEPQLTPDEKVTLDNLREQRTILLERQQKIGEELRKAR